MVSKKNLSALGIVLILLFGLAVAIVLTRQEQDIRPRAVAPNGTATLTLQPATAQYQVGDTFDVQVLFSNATAVSGIATRLTYPFSGVAPEVTATAVTINSDLLGSGDWSCPIKSIDTPGNTVQIEISCLNTSITGFAANTDTLLATVSFAVDSIPTINPVIVTFDESLSAITDKAQGEDVLAPLSVSGGYTISGEITGPTPSPDPVIQACENSGGTWRQFNNGCADLCGNPTICTQNIVNSCDCPGNACWDGATCAGGTVTPIPTSSPTPVPTLPPAGACSGGDINQDGIVDRSDYDLLVADFFKANPANSRTDINGDDVVDISDYSILVANYGIDTGACI